MLEVPLHSHANQTFSTSVNGRYFDIEFRTFRSVIYASFRMDGELVAAGVKCVHDADLLPKMVADEIGGNFFFYTQDGSLPSYKNFDGIKCRFLFRGNGE